LEIFLVFTFSLDFADFFPFFPTKFQSKENSKPRKNVGLGGGEGD
jgi:hypothetical protein